MLNYSIALMSAQPGTLADNVTEKKCYAHLQSNVTVDLPMLCEHMASHNSPFSAGAISGIITDMVKCIRELLLDGCIVKIGDLGKFSCQAQSRGTANASDFTSANITAINVNFTPGKKFENLRDQATFQLVATREAQAEALAKEKTASANTEEDDMRSE